MVTTLARPAAPPTDFAAELGRIERDLEELGPHALAEPLDTERATRLVYRRYQRASLTGDLDELAAADRAIGELVSRVRNPSDLRFLKASAAFKVHRLDEVRRQLEASPDLRESAAGRALEADLDFQEGRYERAREGYERLVREERSWDALARLAHYESKMGDLEAADGLYAEAEDELTAKEMRHFSWVELQRGELDMARGRLDDAGGHYARAERAYSGHWVTAEHAAELRAARGDLDGAVALYEQVVKRVPRPELQQSLGEVCARAGRTDEAEAWFEQARARFLESAERGEVHYYHHLVDFYTDVRPDGAEAVRWAQKDIELRRNFSTLGALAWALHRDGRTDEALAAIDEALASGARDAHLYRRAATIRRAAGADGSELLRMANEINPHHHAFHTHR